MNGIQISAGVSGQKTGSLDLVLAYENDGVILRIQEKMSLSQEESEKLFDDMKRFLYMVGVNRGARFGPPEMIDEAWHHFILFTHDYADFCKKYFGTFIHHVPNTSARFVEHPRIMAETFDTAFSLFGELSENWAKKAGSCVGGSCSSDCTQCSGTTNCQSVTTS